MNPVVLNKLTSNHYKALKALYDQRAITKDGRFVISVTQDEIAKQLKVSNPTIVGIFKSLIHDQLIVRDGNKRGRYYITGDGIRVVECFEQVLQ